MASKKTPLQYLAQVPLFSSCSTRDLGKIAKAADRINMVAGTTIITQGTAGKQAFVALFEAEKERLKEAGCPLPL